MVEGIKGSDAKVTQPCLTLQPHGLYSPWNSPGPNTGVGSHFLLPGIFPRIEPGSPASQADSLPAELWGKPQRNKVQAYNKQCHSPYKGTIYEIHPLFSKFASSTAHAELCSAVVTSSPFTDGRSEAILCPVMLTSIFLQKKAYRFIKKKACETSYMMRYRCDFHSKVTFIFSFLFLN